MLDPLRLTTLWASTACYIYKKKCLNALRVMVFHPTINLRGKQSSSYKPNT
jgi:hypothetical protein